MGLNHNCATDGSTVAGVNGYRKQVKGRPLSYAGQGKQTSSPITRQCEIT